MLDGSQALEESDLEAIETAKKANNVLVVINKSDLPQLLELPENLGHKVEVCAKSGMGLQALEDTIQALFPVGDVPAGKMLTDLRQQQAVQEAHDAIVRGKEGLAVGMTPDAILMDVEQAITAMGNLTGKTASDDIVARLFERFCVGK